MKRTRETATGVVYCIAERIAVILFLLQPAQFASFVLMGMGVVLMFHGGVEVIKYVPANGGDAAGGQMLVRAKV